MTLSSLPLGYCTNVHAGRSLAEVEEGLDRYTVAVARNVGGPLAAGLWLAQPVVQEILAGPDGPRRLADRLARRGLTCYTLNAFPYGDFHSERVKEQVYLPDWSQPERPAYTLDCAAVLAALLPEGTEGSISTLPLGFKEFAHASDFLMQAMGGLIETARSLDRLHDETGKLIRLAIEPEPFCLLETTDEAVAFFASLWARAEDEGAGEAVRRHLGLCYDVCHQAVEFEDAAESVRTLDRAGVRINKVHVTCALELRHAADNPAGRQALARYAEPRYLHQTFARTRIGEIGRVVDLTEELALEPEGDFLDADVWRIHFHVPVDAERLGPLHTTRPELKRALAAVAGLDYAPHLEIETYTWEVLPDGPSADLVEGLTREVAATRELVGRVGS